MKNRLKAALTVLMAALLCLLAAGCSFRFTASPDDLYSLPQMPSQYKELKNRIEKLRQEGAEYASPVSGANVQTVQMVDLDGDGKEEALVFMRNSEQSDSLAIYIFKARGSTYRQMSVIRGSGTAIYSIAYSDLNQDGYLELIIGWKTGTDLQSLSVYSIQDKKPHELLHIASYVRYAIADLNQDKLQELVVLRSDSDGGLADYYTWNHSGNLSLKSSAPVSMTMAELSNPGRVRSGTLSTGKPALFVTGISASGTAITDILTDKNSELVNIVLSDTTGVSKENYRSLSLFPTDINGDGVTEVPAPQALPTKAKTLADMCYQINWQTYDENGNRKTMESTCHDTEDGWYLVLPRTWDGKIAATRGASGLDEMAVTFSIMQGSTLTDFLRIYTITGENREAKAVSGNRFVLVRQSSTIYAAEFLDANQNWKYGISADRLRSMFSLITTEWQSGDN